MHVPSSYIDIPYVDLCSWVLDSPSYDVDKPIYVDAHDESQSLSYRQSLSYIRKVIAGLKAWGVKPGESVCLHSFNSIWYSILFLGITGARGTVVGSNPAYTKNELSHLFTVTETKYLVVHPEQLEKVWTAAQASNIPRERVSVFNTTGDEECGFKSWHSLLDHGESDWYRFNDEHEAKTTPVMLASTSGTTGLPKAAIMPHHSFVAVSKQAEDSKNKPYQIRRLLCLPQFHLFPAHLIHVAPLQEGCTTFVMRRWDLSLYIEFIERYRITETAVTTPIVLSLLSLPAERQKKIQSLRYVLSAGAPLGRSDQNALREICYPEASVTQVWGLTEIGWVTKFNYPEDDFTGSVGRMMPCNEAKVVDENGNELTDPEARGEILIRGPGIMVGYRDNPVATKAMLVDGWLHTGDIGYQKDGKWYIVDRVKDLIKVRGWQVSPSEIEQNLLLHPAIRDAAVIGIDLSDGRGELPKAYIVLNSPAISVTKTEILNFLGERLARYKTLAGGIVRIAAIPRNPSGKILKRTLRERAQREADIQSFPQLNDVRENSPPRTDARPQNVAQIPTSLQFVSQIKRLADESKAVTVSVVGIEQEVAA